MTRVLCLLLLASFIQVMTASCPQTCICIWKNGKETVECINRDLGEIPEGIEPSTQVIDVRGNSIPNLMDDIFVDLGITNLQKIFVQYCKIRTVEPKAFRKLTNLVELDLGENLIQEVPSEAWKHTKALMRLNLSGNPIKHIKSHSFRKLPFLLTLELSHCRIEVIMDEAFAGLESLEWLKLEDNSISSLSGEGLFPETLKVSQDKTYSRHGR
jgi:Leucine-rich repeat (LRR) protein